MFKSLKRKLDQWKRIERTDIDKKYIKKVKSRKTDYLGNDDGTTGQPSEKT